MTEENRRRNVELEVQRAERALNSARILREQGEFADSVSRAYYGMMSYTRSLLLRRHPRSAMLV